MITTKRKRRKLKRYIEEASPRLSRYSLVHEKTIVQLLGHSIDPDSLLTLEWIWLQQKKIPNKQTCGAGSCYRKEIRPMLQCWVTWVNVSNQYLPAAANVADFVTTRRVSEATTSATKIDTVSENNFYHHESKFWSAKTICGTTNFENSASVCTSLILYRARRILNWDLVTKYGLVFYEVCMKSDFCSRTLRCELCSSSLSNKSVHAFDWTKLRTRWRATRWRATRWRNIYSAGSGRCWSRSRHCCISIRTIHAPLLPRGLRWDCLFTSQFDTTERSISETPQRSISGRINHRETGSLGSRAWEVKLNENPGLGRVYFDNYLHLLREIRIPNLKFQIQNSKLKIANSKFQTQNSKFKIPNAPRSKTKIEVPQNHCAIFPATKHACLKILSPVCYSRWCAKCRAVCLKNEPQCAKYSVQFYLLFLRCFFVG